MWGNSWLDEEILGSQGGRCCIKLTGTSTTSVNEWTLCNFYSSGANHMTVKYQILLTAFASKNAVSYRGFRVSNKSGQALSDIMHTKLRWLDDSLCSQPGMERERERGRERKRKAPEELVFEHAWGNSTREAIHWKQDLRTQKFLYPCI